MECPATEGKYPAVDSTLNIRQNGRRRDRSGSSSAAVRHQPPSRHFWRLITAVTCVVVGAVACLTISRTGDKRLLRLVPANTVSVTAIFTEDIQKFVGAFYTKKRFASSQELRQCTTHYYITHSFWSYPNSEWVFRYTIGWNINRLKNRVFRFILDNGISRVHMEKRWFLRLTDSIPRVDPKMPCGRMTRIAHPEANSYRSAPCHEVSHLRLACFFIDSPRADANISSLANVHRTEYLVDSVNRSTSQHYCKNCDNHTPEFLLSGWSEPTYMLPYPLEYLPWPSKTAQWIILATGCICSIVATKLGGRRNGYFILWFVVSFACIYYSLSWLLLA